MVFIKFFYLFIKCTKFERITAFMCIFLSKTKHFRLESKYGFLRNFFTLSTYEQLQF